MDHNGTQRDTVGRNGRRWDAMGRDGTQWDAVEHVGTRWAVVGWCWQSSGEASPGRMRSARMELSAVWAFLCPLPAAAQLRGLIRLTNNDGTCDLRESFGYNYVGHQVKESPLD